MWSLAIFLYVVFKWLAYHLSEVNLAEPANRDALRTWFYCWPGMDPLPFLDRAGRDVSRVPARKWIRAFATISSGLFLLYVAARQAPADQFMAIGWIGMAGFLLTLHIGVFELRANYWQGKGIRVRSIMNSPHRAGTVPAVQTEFLQRWGPSPQWRDWPFTPFTRTASSCDYEYDEEQESSARNWCPPWSISLGCGFAAL
jgi:hypothetical protein